MANVYVKPECSGAHVISDVDGVSKDEITLSGGNFVAGEVLALSADGSKYIKLGLDDGSEAKAVLFASCDATDCDAAALAHTRVCSVLSSKLVWPDSITEARKLEFVNDLIAAHIIPR